MKLNEVATSYTSTCEFGTFEEFYKSKYNTSAPDTLNTRNMLSADMINCANRGITSLKGAPQNVIGGFFCSNNRLTSLEYAPKKATLFDCSFNKITSLNGCPQETTLLCVSANRLTSLVGVPTKVSSFHCGENPLSSLVGAPSDVQDAYFNDVGLTSLVGIDDIFEKANHLLFSYNKITAGGLGLLLIKGLTSLSCVHTDIMMDPFEIISKYLNSGHSRIYECQQELIEAGFEEYAQL